MDFLKRQMAPLTGDAWHEIEERAAEALKTNLSARKVVRVNGPKGLNYTVIPEGRLNILDNKEGDVRTGLYQVKPLVETRISFELDRWEMDNVARGARDIDLESLEEAARKAALFEEEAIYNGYAPAGIIGLNQAAKGEAIPFGKDNTSILEGLTKGMLRLKDAFEVPPLTLVVGEEGWTRINRELQSYPLAKRIEGIIGGGILYSPVLDGALLLPYDNENLELTIGLDFSIGYETHDTTKLRLFFAESFTFRVLDPNIIIRFTM